MTIRERAAALLAIVLIGASTVPLVSRQEDPFPHRSHDGLFPLCEGCHEGIATEASVGRFPEPSSCTSCHDGTREERVEWAGREPRITNLAFSHATHARKVTEASDSATCQSCHATGVDDVRMAVAAATPESCTGCHTHVADQHLDDARDCAVCHVPLTDARELTVERIAAFEKPLTHTDTSFILNHAPADVSASTRCAVCHATESCARCHLNASAVPAITALNADPRIAAVVASLMPEYPTPASHAAEDWDGRHGSAATATTAGCANCHTRASCRTCHQERSVPAIEALPAGSAGDPRGVSIARQNAEVHPVGYERRHGTDAATSESTCASCHAAETCATCHDAAGTPSFHQPNFLATHGPSTYGNDTDCSSCHNREVFCRGCHDRVGLGAADRLGVAFHTANPFWIVGHGRAARQGLESCATCHGQTSCTRCHSAIGGWRVSPHPPGWDGSRAEAANPLNCRLCHRRGGGP